MKNNIIKTYWKNVNFYNIGSWINEKEQGKFKYYDKDNERVLEVIGYYKDGKWKIVMKLIDLYSKIAEVQKMSNSIEIGNIIFRF